MSKPFTSYPISSKSRTKLNAFRYDDKAEQSPEKSPPKSPAKSPSKLDQTTKENQVSWLNGVAEQEQPQPGKEQPLSQVADSKHVKECPHTPVNRLPLADLIGNAEDAISRAPGQEFTPEDHVIWQHVPTSSNSGSVSQSSRGKKRRHSSTPSSSPLADNSKYTNQESIDMLSAQALLKTPQNDLVTDLWNNYVGKGILNGNGDLPPPRLQNLLSSSPQTPASAKSSRDSSGLRRAISCNADWPTSKAKRRRVDGDGSRTGRNIFSRSRSNVLDSGNAKITSLRSLVEKMESLHKAPAAPADPPSSSPGPVRANVQHRNRSVSPIEKKTALRASEKESTKSVNSTLETESRVLREGTPEGSSSEFQDDDLDLDLLEFADATLDSFTEPVQSHTNAKSMKREPGSKEPQSNDHSMETMSRSASAGMNNKNVTNDSDEFDYDDDELPDNIRMVLDGCDETAAPEPGEHYVGSPILTHAAPTNPSKETEKPGVSSGDEFDDEDFDFEAIEQSMRQSDENGPSNNIRSRQAIKRYLIVDTAEDTYTSPKGRIQPEQILLVQDEKSKLRKVVILRESWFDSPCSKGSYIHLIGEFDAQGHCVVDNSQNMIILHPDHLISATVISDSTSCQRRAVLQDRIKYSSDIGKPQVFGNVFHEIFQDAMKTNKWDLSSLRSLTTAVLTKHVEELYVIEMSISQAVEYVMGRIPALRSWAETFLSVNPTNESVVEDRNSSKMHLSINKLLEVEEHIWSPMYGLKGNIDATVQVACNDGEGDKNLVIPLELKTGNRDTNHAHRAQTALYTLLLSDRYDVDVNFGLLYYLEISKIFRIRGVRHELLQMIQERNRLAGYVRQRHQLPPMAKRPGMCNKCYARTPCLVYHKLADDGNGESSGLGEDFDKTTDHLTPRHQEFFKKWDHLLTKEEQDMMKFRRELWTLLSSEREALGRCFGNVVIEPGSSSDDNDDVKINRFRYTFIKKQAPPSFSFTESQLTLGEPIVVSDEKGHFALANGYVVHVSPKRITVAVDRRLHNARTRTSGFDPKWNQSFKGVMEILENGASATTAQSDDSEEEIVYRLDKDEFSNGMAIVRSNIVAMMERDLFQAKQLRRLIVDGEAPVFKPTPSPQRLPDTGKSNLNIDQKQAIDKVMSAKDYALVLGMPGTGKTTTIAHIIRALVSQGKSVLLTSYTHTAVDNILLKIRDENVRILRIGATAKVHPEVQQFVDLAATPKTSVEEVKARYEDSQIVATTCLGINHNIFSRRIFDYCIVDEASQITLPVCLGPIRMARTFILVGDHFQLPPLVQNKEAQEGGLDVSLFKLLSDSHPDSVVNLEHQYRMSEDIMSLSNTLVYSGHLKCGTPEVASRSLVIPNIAGLKQQHIDQFPQTPGLRQLCLGTSQGRCWLRDLLDPSAKTRFVNTDTLAAPAREVAVGSRIVNPTESKLCAQLVEAFLSCGISASNIGVITFYRSQLSVLKQDLRHHLPELEMHTADKFQGRDKEIVILSCVRSNADSYVGELLNDWRRVNVAFTRARTKLLVLGSKNTLRDGNELLGKYMNLVENRRWVYNLPKGAVEDHVFQHDSMCARQTQPRHASPSKASPSPKKKSSQTKAARNPLSPVQGRKDPNGVKQPAKKGAKILNGNRVLGNRPILQDVVNDLVG